MLFPPALFLKPYGPGYQSPDIPIGSLDLSKRSCLLNLDSALPRKSTALYAQLTIELDSG